MADTALRTIRDNIRTLIEEVTGLQVVYSEPTLNIDGYPAAIIEVADQDGQYSTNIENKHNYRYTIFLINEISDTAFPTAYNTLMDLLEQVQIKLMKEDAPNTTRTIDDGIPTGYTIQSVRPTVGRIEPLWQEKILYAPVLVTVMLEIDLENVA